MKREHNGLWMIVGGIGLVSIYVSAFIWCIQRKWFWFLLVCGLIGQGVARLTGIDEGTAGVIVLGVVVACVVGWKAFPEHRTGA